MERTEVISTLNDLLQTTKDGQECFRACAENVESGNLKTMFEGAASRCDQGAGELERTIRGLGGEPMESGAASASLHHAWTNLKASIAGMDEHAILVECDHEEDAAENLYETALQKDLPADVRTLVERQFRGVKENHDRIRHFRDAA